MKMKLIGVECLKNDFISDMSDQDLMHKYGLSEKAFRKVLHQLVKAIAGGRSYIEMPNETEEPGR